MQITLKRNVEDIIYIPCPPLLGIPTPPNDAGQIEECPKCNQEMWVTDRNRKKKEECYTDFIILKCSMCVVNDCNEIVEVTGEDEYMVISPFNIHPRL